MTAPKKLQTITLTFEVYATDAHAVDEAVMAITRFDPNELASITMVELFGPCEITATASDTPVTRRQFGGWPR